MCVDYTQEILTDLIVDKQECKCLDPTKRLWHSESEAANSEDGAFKVCIKSTKRGYLLNVTPFSFLTATDFFFKPTVRACACVCE